MTIVNMKTAAGEEVTVKLAEGASSGKGKTSKHTSTESPPLLIAPLAAHLAAHLDRRPLDKTDLLPNIQPIDIGCGSLGLLDLPVGQ